MVGVLHWLGCGVRGDWGHIVTQLEGFMLEYLGFGVSVPKKHFRGGWVEFW